MSLTKKTLKVVKAVILDIEGTIIDSDFLPNQLFPKIRESYEPFLNDTYESAETILVINRLRKLQESQMVKGMPIIVVGNKKEVIRSIVDNVKWQMDNKKHNTEIKLMELLCWLWVFQKKLLKTHLYDDVSYSLHEWKDKRIKIYTFSGALELAQKLLLCNTIHGNIYVLIDGFFDASFGSRKKSESFKLISQNINLEVRQILFITDDPKEAKAAINAGLKAVIIIRSGYNPKEFPEIPRIYSFKDIPF